MNTIRHQITPHLQPTNNRCGYAALATLLSHYDKSFSVEELISKVPQPKDNLGKTYGSLTAQLADWCQTEGLQVTMFASDMYVLDLSWKSYDSNKLLQRLIKVHDKRTSPLLDKYWMGMYEQAYIDFLEHGGELQVKQFISSDLLLKLLQKGPIFVNVCSAVSSGNGRTVSPKLRSSIPDDIHGTIVTHSVVAYGINKAGNFLIADPWYGDVILSPEELVLSIAAAQIECDNQIFILDIT